MTRFHHSNLRISDAAASLAFYRAIGLDHVGTLSLGPGYTLLFVGQSDGTAVLELVLNDTTDPAYDRSPGSGHIGVEVDDIDATLSALAELGVTPEAPPAHPGGRTDLERIAFVRDPDGVRVELLQAHWPVPQDALPADVRLG
ncbi:VOC family protein [Herbiconiux sp. UC225_62]|uniref:VOC family protein n=1 Tax=Herbiconiux sp. UC225_62 TaxID=3350168 RepID=UPI0036D40D75